MDRSRAVLVVLAAVSVLLAGCTASDITSMVSGSPCSTASSYLSSTASGAQSVDTCVCSTDVSEGETGMASSLSNDSVSKPLRTMHMAFMKVEMDGEVGALPVFVYEFIDGSYSANVSEYSTSEFNQVTSGWSDMLFTSKSDLEAELSSANFEEIPGCSMGDFESAFGFQSSSDTGDGQESACQYETVTGACPTDPDGDGNPEDIDGNGSATVEDAELFFNNYESLDSVSAYDFNGDGSLDVSDAQALLDEIQ